MKQPDISKMLRGDFRQFSVERLLRFHVALRQDVEIVATPHRGTHSPPNCASAAPRSGRPGEQLTNVPTYLRAQGAASIEFYEYILPLRPEGLHFLRSPAYVEYLTGR